MTSTKQRIKNLKNFGSIDQSFKKWLTTCPKDYIKKLVIHEVDVITDSDWFSSQIDSALIALNVDKEEK